MSVGERETARLAVCARDGSMVDCLQSFFIFLCCTLLSCEVWKMEVEVRGGAQRANTN